MMEPESKSPLSKSVLWPRALVLVAILAGGYLWQCRKASPPPPSSTTPAPQTSASAATTQGEELRAVTNWGPRSTRVMTPFNIQPNGHSAVWVLGEGAAGVQLELGGTMLPSYATETAVSATVSPELLRTIAARPATLPLYLVGHEPGQRQQVGFFEILD
jgi:hypothetical protein